MGVSEHRIAAKSKQGPFLIASWARAWAAAIEVSLPSVASSTLLTLSKVLKRSSVRAKEDAQDAVSSAERVLASAGLKAIGAVLSGSTKDVILEEAKKWAADLIVVGSHGRRGFKRFLLGSVSEAIAMNAHCSVVVVRGLARSSRKARASG